MTAILSTEHLTVTRGKTICRNFSITIHPGERWAILGPNGSGKSTLLHCLAGLHAPTTGTIKLNHSPLKSLSSRQVAQRIGILLQDTYFPFPQTVYEYCLTNRFPYQPALSLKPCQPDDLAIINAAIHEMQISHLAHKNIQQLSGGEKRRVAITALLIQNPAVYLLDEPDNHLDLHQQFKILDQVSKKADANHAVMMTLHDINLAQQFCDHCLMIFHDASILHGKTDEILTTENICNLYQHPMQSIHADGKLYWLPKQLKSKE